MTRGWVAIKLLNLLARVLAAAPAAAAPAPTAADAMLFDKKNDVAVQGVLSALQRGLLRWL